ncbi:phenylalanine--tRNA ligase subunit alpha [Candidatus Gracilibacteria bacterium]|nr:MAG: phenylalanine--tRNA ligase subunit alpha [Candidatus Gracilibacteria bacterium]
MSSLLDTLISLEQEAKTSIQKFTNEKELFAYKATLFGKNGGLTEILKGLKDASPEEKKEIGKKANTIRDTLTKAFEEKRESLKDAKIEEQIKKEWQDVTEPLQKKQGTLHPLTQSQKQIEEIFTRMGFSVYDSMEITSEYLNFDAVNIQKNHPARDMQDTFWLEGECNVLATQTSCMQNLILKHKEAPIRAIIPGRVFRNEDIDATHENTFYQIEGVVVDKHINIGNLKFTIETMLSEIFEKEVSIRMRPGYFPFVEPGVEIDFSCPFCVDTSSCKVCKGSGWIEFMGAGLMHPNVIREGGFDPEVYTGFAFGFGLNRLVMIQHGIPDMRYFMNPDIRFLQQF